MVLGTLPQKKQIEGHRAEREGEEIKKKERRRMRRKRKKQQRRTKLAAVNVSYPDSMKSWVVVEEFHLFCRQWPQNLLNGEELEVK